MKVFFVGAGYDGCYYVRCLLPLVYNGWRGTKMTADDKPLTAEQTAKEIMAADIIVFQRPMTVQMYDAAIKLKGEGKKIVYDNDDTYIKDSGVPTAMLRTAFDEDKIRKKIGLIDERLKSFAAMADMVTVSTDFLAKEYEEVNKNVVVLPNCVEPDDYEPEFNHTETVRIGLVGSVASNQDYKQIIPLLDSLKGRENVKLVLFSLPPNHPLFKRQREIYAPEILFWEQYAPEWQPWVNMSQYAETLAGLKLDIMLIPRFDNYFNRCKSNVKYLEASMLKIPVIAQGFPDGLSPYQKDIDGENGIICQTEEEWLAATERLIESKEARRRMGEKAHQYVLSQYNIGNLAHKWEEAYKTL